MTFIDAVKSGRDFRREIWAEGWGFGFREVPIHEDSYDGGLPGSDRSFVVLSEGMVQQLGTTLLDQDDFLAEDWELFDFPAKKVEPILMKKKQGKKA